MSDNFNIFKDKIFKKGMDFEEAAWNTPSGSWAKRNGFTKVLLPKKLEETIHAINPIFLNN